MSFWLVSLKLVFLFGGVDCCKKALGVMRNVGVVGVVGVGFVVIACAC